MDWLLFLLFLLVGYLLGSIPTGLILGKWLKNIDVRQFGSGKTGATNTLRTLGWKISLSVFLIDALKGGIAVWLPVLYFTDAPDNWLPWVRMLAAFVCMLGHDFPVWIGFKGGRGVAVGVGELLVVSPFVWILTFFVTFPTILITRYVSLGSIVGSIFTVVFTIIAIFAINLDPRYLGFSIVSALLVIVMHRDNITRLLNGTERKLGDKASKVKPSSEQNPTH
jgi:glycerol-3-phosphate acyltransferase PlsY